MPLTDTWGQKCSLITTLMGMPQGFYPPPEMPMQASVHTQGQAILTGFPYLKQELTSPSGSRSSAWCYQRGSCD